MSNDHTFLRAYVKAMIIMVAHYPMVLLLADAMSTICCIVREVKRRTDLCGVDLLAERLGSRTRAPPLRQTGRLFLGSDANTLRTSALALIFSTAEYCAPVWEGSCHTKLIDTQLNSTLRIITGVCQPTRIDWLPVLAHISPPELRRKEATKKMYQKLLDSPDLEINPILQTPPNHRLKSRKPIWSRGNQLLSQNFNISEAWTNSWISSDIPNKNPHHKPKCQDPRFFPPSTRMGASKPL
ncbi:hypothetical protein LAZ67_10002861 [Cordylochernes scorpioides]|uniref:RNA-directed DNA polymerase from mobile element jockey n=1 Tax=Cordylochernes scorpioides TaxID=51811 RepID=A0ABY6KWW5_9ARAC|nr:hypothetical protein LAZ67_10002861 [Cordylochernes scorpioides]